MTTYGNWLEGLDYNAIADRQVLTELYDGIEGVGGAGDLIVSAGGGMSVDVAAGFAAIAGDVNPGQGMYLLRSTAVENLTGITADGSNPRRVLVYAAIEDADEAGSGTDQAVIEYVLGTPAATPVNPALPANAVSLAQLQVPAGASSITSGMITETRQLHGRARRPKGRINQKSFGSQTTSIGGAGGLDCVGSDMTATVEKGRRIQYAADVRIRCNTGLTVFTCTVELDGSPIGPEAPLAILLANTDFIVHVRASSLIATTGSHTWNVHCERSTGVSGDLGTVGSASYCTLDDMGGVI